MDNGVRFIRDSTVFPITTTVLYNEFKKDRAGDLFLHSIQNSQREVEAILGHNERGMLGRTKRYNVFLVSLNPILHGVRGKGVRTKLHFQTFLELLKLFDFYFHSLLNIL